VCTCKGKEKKPANKQWKEKIKEYMKRNKTDERDRHGKHSKKANKQAKKQPSKRTNKWWCLQGTNIGLD